MRWIANASYDSMKQLSTTTAFSLVALSITSFMPALAEPPHNAKELPTAQPEEVGMSSRKLAKIDARMAELLEQKRFAGAAVMVTRKGKVVYNKTFGLRDVESGEQMDDETVFRIYSMTKAITSVAVMMLAEEGKVDIDQPVSKYIPSFDKVRVWKEGEAVQPEKAPTVRDLLRHTSGYTYGATPVPEISDAQLVANPLSPRNTLEEMADAMAKVPLLFEPGTRWVYGVSTDLLGRVVEVASGMPFDQFLQKRIFDPLGMHDTSFTLKPGMKERLAAMYQSDQKGKLTRLDQDDSSYAEASKLRSGGGGLLSTIRDYTRFLQMLANGGELQGVRLLKESTVKEMTRNQLPDSAMPISVGPEKREGTGFGLGFSVKVRDTKWNKDGRLGEYGWGGMASTHYWVSPQDDLVVVTMEQTVPFDFLLEDELKPLIYDAIKE